MTATRFILGAVAAMVLASIAACQPTRYKNQLPASTEGLATPAKNGARIYFTGASERGTAATIEDGANPGGGMMGGYRQWLTCAACHGPEARGGKHEMHMSVMDAPDIRYAALRTMSELKGRQRPYDLDDFRQQVEQGRHPDGAQVKQEMPRWQMSEADLADLFAFLKSQPE